jgi:hypothetical protein
MGMLGSPEVGTDDGVLADVPGARLRGLALLVYQRTRQALADALGVDPHRNCPHCMSRCCGASWDGGRKTGRPTCAPS